MDIEKLLDPLFPWLCWEDLGRMTMVCKQWYDKILVFCRVEFLSKIKIKTTMEDTGFPVVQQLMISGESLKALRNQIKSEDELALYASNCNGILINLTPTLTLT
jgi:hypothetical protein